MPNELYCTKETVTRYNRYVQLSISSLTADSREPGGHFSSRLSAKTLHSSTHLKLDLGLRDVLFAATSAGNFLCFSKLVSYSLVSSFSYFSLMRGYPVYVRRR